VCSNRMPSGLRPHKGKPVPTDTLCGYQHSNRRHSNRTIRWERAREVPVPSPQLPQDFGLVLCTFRTNRWCTPNVGQTSRSKRNLHCHPLDTLFRDPSSDHLEETRICGGFCVHSRSIHARGPYCQCKLVLFDLMTAACSFS
jgi:hypothetical protein